MTIAQFFDEVEAGISDAEAFLAKIAQPLEAMFGAGALANGIAALFSDLQQECAKVKIVVDDVEQALVMTETVYAQIQNVVAEVIAQAKIDVSQAGGGGLNVIEAAVADLLEDGVPLVLTMVFPGASPVISFSEDLLRKLVTTLI